MSDTNPESLSEFVRKHDEEFRRADESTAQMIRDFSHSGVHQSRSLVSRKSNKVDPDIVKALALWGTPPEKIARKVGLSLRTLYRRFGKIMADAALTGEIMIRRAAFSEAVVEKNSVMLLHEKKHRCDEPDTLQVTGLNGGPIDIRHEHDFRTLSTEELNDVADKTRKQILALQGDIDATLASAPPEIIDAARQAVLVDREAEDGGAPEADTPVEGQSS